MQARASALVQLGLMPAPTVKALVPAVPDPCPPVSEVEPAPARTPRTDGKCDVCGRLAFEPRVDAEGNVSCFECREERCDICERIGNRRVTRNDGIVICGPCSKRAEEAATLKAFLNTPASVVTQVPVETPAVEPVPCCVSGEPVPCLPCSTPELEPAQVEPDSEPLPEPATIEPTAEDRQEAAEAFTAMDVQAYLDRSGELPLVEAIDHIGNAFRGWRLAVRRHAGHRARGARPEGVHDRCHDSGRTADRHRDARSRGSRDLGTGRPGVSRASRNRPEQSGSSRLASRQAVVRLRPRACPAVRFLPVLSNTPCPWERSRGPSLTS